jgi:HEAT repeat protein
VYTDRHDLSLGESGSMRPRIAGTGVVLLFVLVSVGLADDPADPKGKPEEQVRELLRDLRDDDEERCAAAVKALGALGGDAGSAVPELVRRLGRPNSDEWAERALVAMGPVAGAAVPDLLALVTSTDPKVQDGAARVLISLGEAAKPAVRELRAELKGPVRDRRWRAALALGKLGPVAGEALPDLIEAIEQGTGQLRWAAVWAMEGYGPRAKAAVPALVAALSDENLRFGAARSLRSIGPAAEAAIPALISRLRQDYYPTLTEALAGIGPAAVPALMKELASRDFAFQNQIANALGMIGRPAVPALVNALEGEDPVLRTAAARALRVAGAEAEEALAPLTEALVDPHAGADAGWALAAMGEKGVAALLRCLRSPDDRVREAAAFALTSVEDVPESAAEDVLSILKTGPSGARTSAATILGNLRYEKAVPALVAVMDGEADGVGTGEAAKTALRRIGPVAIPELLGAVYAGTRIKRMTAIWFLARSGWKDPRIEPAIRALRDDPDPKIRSAVEGALKALAETD